MENNYDDIINLPHHVSVTRAQMPLRDRAAQFSPFAALVGYDAAIKETARLTDAKIQLDDEALSDLNIKLRFLSDYSAAEPEVKITYFKEDESKEGGAYVEATGIVKKADAFERTITLHGGEKIPMDDVVNIECEALESLAEKSER